MPTITEVGNSSNTYSSPGLTIKDEFIPYLNFDIVTFMDQKIPEEETRKVDADAKDRVKLEKYFKEDIRDLGINVITTNQQKIKFPFKIEDGSGETWDDNGMLTITPSIDDGTIKIIAPAKLPIKKAYGDTIEIELEITLEKSTEFYLDFFASDDTEDTNTGELKDLPCGRVKVSFEKIKSSKVGLRLTENIEKLPLAPNGYIEPPTFSEPKKSFEAGNTYQNSFGMCFAVSMARVRKAYQDEFNVEVLSLDLKNNDYLYSGTIVTSIPDKYFGYGVGGALASKNHAILVDENGVKNGDLEEGAMLQYWNTSGTINIEVLKQAIKKSINQVYTGDFQGGHSVIFKSYIKDSSNNITGLNYYDYSGIGRSYSFLNNSRLFLGANLKDIK